MKKILKQRGQKNRKERGITLIALVITVIVLLILAGVTIATLTGDNGILSNASKAREQTEIAQVKEMAQTDILAKQTENQEDISKEELVEILNKYFNDVPIGDNLPEDLSTLILTTKEEYGNHDINISEIWNGTFFKTIETLKAGDKVNYIDKNGNTIECIVLYDSNSEYGVQIISADIVDTVTLGGSDFETAKESYNSALEILYNKAQEYLNTTYAISARCVGSKPDDPEWDTEEMIGEKDGEFFSILKQYSDILKRGDDNYNIDLSQMEIITGVDIKTARSDYWIASRFFDSSSSQDFGIWKINTNSELKKGWLICLTSWASNTYFEESYGFRPVFTLKLGLKITGGDGVNIPYTIGQ